jgi:hypothetical protein
MMPAVMRVSSKLHTARQSKQHVAVGAIVFLSVGRQVTVACSAQTCTCVCVCYGGTVVELDRCIENITIAALAAALRCEFERWPRFPPWRAARDASAAAHHVHYWERLRQLAWASSAGTTSASCTDLTRRNASQNSVCACSQSAGWHESVQRRRLTAGHGTTLLARRYCDQAQHVQQTLKAGGIPDSTQHCI